MEIQIIVIDEAHVDFDMKLEIVNFKRKKLALISIRQILKNWETMLIFVCFN